MHYSHLEETVSSLRFAQRAKHIQNRVKMNYKTSPESLRVLIEQLREELKDARMEISRLQQIQSCPFETANGVGEQDGGMMYRTYQGEAERAMKSSSSKLIAPPHESIPHKNMNSLEQSSRQLLSLPSSELSTIPLATPNFTSPVKPQTEQRLVFLK